MVLPQTEKQFLRHSVRGFITTLRYLNSYKCNKENLYHGRNSNFDDRSGFTTLIKCVVLCYRIETAFCWEN